MQICVLKKRYFCLSFTRSKTDYKLIKCWFLKYKNGTLKLMFRRSNFERSAPAKLTPWKRNSAFTGVVMMAFKTSLLVRDAVPLNLLVSSDESSSKMLTAPSIP